MLFLAAKDSHVTNTGTVVLLTITTAQLCSFAVAGLLAAAAAEDGQTCEFPAAKHTPLHSLGSALFHFTSQTAACVSCL